MPVDIAVLVFDRVRSSCEYKVLLYCCNPWYLGFAEMCYLLTELRIILVLPSIHCRQVEQFAVGDLPERQPRQRGFGRALVGATLAGATSLAGPCASIAEYIDPDDVSSFLS